MKTDGLYVIRLATVKDVVRMTNLHCASFQPEDHVPMMLGERYVQATYRWQVTSQTTYALVAEAGSKIVGLIAVSDGSFTRPMFKACLTELAASLMNHPALFFQPKLWQRLLRRSSHLNDQADKIAHYPGMSQMIIGAVDTGYRGKGVFPALIEATTHESKKRGSRAIRAGVYKHNLPVQRAFIKAGWDESPIFETEDTKFYIYFIDPDLRAELGTD
jgi:ribosomal protein S18 acetylase RimI-like enzyme